jgi:2,6-dihydroxypseudooxynicotine hydrolase
VTSEVSRDTAEIEMVLTRNVHRMFAAGLPSIEIDWARGADLTTWPAWNAYWIARARSYGALAEAAQGEGRVPTAAGHYMTGALCAHFAHFMIFDDSKLAASDLSVEYFHRAAPLVSPRVDILYTDDARTGIKRIPIAFSVPEGPGPHPCVLMIPGLEANKIELQGWQRYFTARGLAFACMEGPGQGEMHEVALTMPDYVSAISAAVDLLQERADVAGDRIGLCGVSLGGLIGSLGVAADGRFHAAAEISGTFDTASRWDVASWISKRGCRHITRSASPEATDALVKTWTMYPVAHRITCPFLVVHGEDDKMIPVAQLDLYRENVPHAQIVRVPRGNHVCNNQAHLVRPMIADWFVDRLAP